MATITTTGSLLFHPITTTHLRRNLNHHHRTSLSFPKPTSFFLPPLKTKPHNFKPSTISSSLINPATFTQTPQQFLPNSTKTLTALFTLTSKFLLKLKTLITIISPPYLQPNVGPLFFAAIQGSYPSGSLVNTPLTVVAAGMAKWLDIYSGVLMVRVLLSWFPNIPWDRQPLSAIRDLCDPYLNLFRNIIPPVFDTLDVSPLLAFAVLGVLGSILKNTTNAAM